MATSTLLKTLWSLGIWLSISTIAVSGETQNVIPARAAALKLLALGFDESRFVPLEELERAYESEKNRLPGGSPYLEYAFSLALTKNLQAKPAEVHLRTAAKSHTPVLLPAHEELIRRTIAAADYRQGLEMLAEYACLIGEIPESEGTAEAHRAAGWLGSMIAFLEGPAETSDEIENLSKLTGNQLKLLLDQRYVQDYEAGRQAVKEAHASLQRQFKEAVTQSESKQLDDRQELETRKEQIGQRATEIKEASLSTQKTLREQLTDVDGKIKILDKQFGLSLEAEQRLIASQILLQAEISRLKVLLQQQSSASNDRFPNSSPFSRAGSLNTQIVAAEAQYALSINQHALLLQSRFELTGNAKALLQARQNLVQQSGTTALQTQSQLELMKRWTNRLESQEKKQDKTSATDATSVARVRRRMNDLATYDNGTLEHRRQVFTSLLQPGTITTDEKPISPGGLP